ncbi:hypothetical protein BGZ60DRAFT_409318 [Tricladium varicosporioides]|nr:hypothetical protein BGZ60DRAFT_409318 [Hymenoscyphus varicosporioides]
MQQLQLKHLILILAATSLAVALVIPETVGKDPGSSVPTVVLEAIKRYVDSNGNHHSLLGLWIAIPFIVIFLIALGIYLCCCCACCAIL